MIITATDKRLRVDFRVAGKQYADPSETGPAEDSAERSTAPFDSQDVEIGASFNLTDDMELVRVVRYEPTAASEDVQGG